MKNDAEKVKLACFVSSKGYDPSSLADFCPLEIKINSGISQDFSFISTSQLSSFQSFYLPNLFQKSEILDSFLT